MRPAFLIAAKDLRERIRDRTAILIAVVVPLVLAFIFSAILGGGSGDTRAIPLGYVDEDGGAVAEDFVQQVLGQVEKSGIATVHSEPSVATATPLVKSGKLTALIVIPPSFTQAVQTGGTASMQVIGNVDSPISAAIAWSIAQGYVAELNRIRIAVLVAAGGNPASLTTDQLNALAAKAASAQAAVVVQDISSERKQLDAKSFYAAGMAVFFVFFSVQFGVTSLLEERNEGTLARLLVAPIDRISILVGKLLTSFTVGVISMGVLVVATSVLFGASWGNPAGVAILVVSAVLSATGITAIIAGFARDAEQAGNMQTVVAVVLGLLGGTFFPVSQAPGILSTLTFIAPQAWFLRGLGDLRGGDLSGVVVPALAMLAFAVVTGAVGVFRLRRVAEV
ncbi:MAG TPA: ABC transporter permease [Candidatus Dormibacteraeota bacterium]|nr:ABC transporter permease [Candidatus Dormibacteraeota bacterium]